MDESKFLKALAILHDENKNNPNTEESIGYAKALYDVLKASALCKLTPSQ